MRISSSHFSLQGVNSILDQQAKLADTQLQLATGRRILSASDDPSGAATVLNLDQAIAATEQFQKNINEGRTRLELSETTLTQVTNVLQRVRELAVQGNNDTTGAAGRRAIAAELRQRIDELVALANSRDANDEYLFSGTRTKTQPFDQPAIGTFRYSGDQGQRALQVSPTRQVAIDDSGFDIFIRVPASAGGTQDIFSTLYGIVTDFEADTRTANGLQDLDLAEQNVLGVRATVGARLHALDAQEEMNDSFALYLQSSRSDIHDLDYAEAISRLNLQLAGFQAAQQAFVKVQGLSLFNYL